LCVDTIHNAVEKTFGTSTSSAPAFHPCSFKKGNMQQQDTNKQKEMEDMIVIQSVAVVAEQQAAFSSKSKLPGNRLGKRARRSTWKTVKDIYEELGPTYFRQACRMKFRTYKKLARSFKERLLLLLLVGSTRPS